MCGPDGYHALVQPDPENPGKGFCSDLWVESSLISEKLEKSQIQAFLYLYFLYSFLFKRILLFKWLIIHTFPFFRLGNKLEDFSGTYDKMNCQCALVRDRFVLVFFTTFLWKAVDYVRCLLLLIVLSQLSTCCFWGWLNINYANRSKHYHVTRFGWDIEKKVKTVTQRMCP